MNWQRGLLFVLFLVSCYFPLFLHLDSLPLHLWDESRRAVNAMEMVQNGNILVSHFEGLPDMYGTKPPLLLWLQALCMKLFGFNELAVRLPSALAALATVLLLVQFCSKHLKLPFAGYLAAWVLLSNTMYINYHGAVTGDYDALLCLWTTAYLLCFYIYLQAYEKRYLYLTGLFITLACLTKGIAGLFFAPGLLLFSIWQKQLGTLLRQRQIYFAGFATLLAILSFYFLREFFNPGYLEAVWNNEVWGRYFLVNEGHQHEFWFYINFVYEYKKFHPWIFIVPFGFLLTILHQPTRSIGKLLLLNSIVFFLIISVSKSKLEWYILPIFPSMALAIGIGFAHIWNAISSFFSLEKHWQQYLFGGLFIIAIFSLPYWKVVHNQLNNAPRGWEKHREVYRDAMESIASEKSYTIVHPHYNGHVVFYKKVWNEKGHFIQQHILHPPASHVQPHGFTTGRMNFQSGQKLLICETEALQRVQSLYPLQQQKNYGNCQLLVIQE